MSSILLYANDDAPKGASPTIIPRRFCRLEMLISGCYYKRFLFLTMMTDGLLFNSAQDGGLHLIAGATESAGSFLGGVLELVLGEADAHYYCFAV